MDPYAAFDHSKSHGQETLFYLIVSKEQRLNFSW